MRIPAGRLMPLLVLALSFLVVAPALATVTMEGTVRVWNPLTSIYQPLQHARVRLVLAEYWDTDTLDVEGQADVSGHYHVTKGNAWWRSGYDAYLIVFAESPNKLEIQTFWGQIDGYQAVSHGFWAADDRTTTTNLNLGGPSDSTRRYQVGGIAALDNSDSTTATRGHRAFVLCHEMTDHRRQLVSWALGESNFEEKEVTYPADVSVADYRGVLDYIRFPDLYFDPGSIMRVSETSRHELSHGIMADEFYLWPGWQYGSFGSHSLWTVADHREWAWSEAWAEFMSEVTHSPRYGRYNDFETQNGGWRGSIPAGADRSRVEGEIAGTLWDIYDPMGWEKRMEQVDAIPGDEMFYDGLSDWDLAKIWDIFADDHPLSFTHESYLGSPDNFVHYWLGRPSYGGRHELKAILYNRGIRVPQLPQQRPEVAIGTVSWTTNTAHIPIIVTEQDAEDRPRVRLELFINGSKTRSEWLPAGWSGALNTPTLDQEIIWRTGDPQPQVMAVAHDDMQTSYVTRTLSPPFSAGVTGLIVEVMSVSVSRQSDPSWMMGSDPGERLRDVSVSLQVQDGATTTTTRLPETGTWTLPADGEARDDTVREAYRRDSVPAYLRLNFTVTGRDGPQDFTETYAAQYSSAVNFGLGTHTDTVLDREREREVMMWVDVDIESRVQVVYRIRALTQTIHVMRPFRELLAVMLPAPAAVAGAQRAPRQPARQAVIPATGLPLTTPDLKGRETPTVLLAISSQLVDEVARLQARALEISEELEHHLGPPPSVRPAPGQFRARSAQPMLLRPDLMTSTSVLKLPPTPFLDQAVAGKGRFTVADAKHRPGLTALRQEASQIDARLTALAKLSPQVLTALDAAQKRISQEKVANAQALQPITALLRQATIRVTSVPPAVAPSRQMIAKQVQVIDKGLGK